MTPHEIQLLINHTYGIRRYVDECGDCKIGHVKEAYEKISSFLNEEMEGLRVDKVKAMNAILKEINK